MNLLANGRSESKHMPLLPREEYVEQAYMFHSLSERVRDGEPVQELLKYVRQEILATTKLPMAIDYLLAELNHVGTMGTAMAKLGHYFTQFQTFIIQSAESETGRFDIRTALLILEHEAKFRGESSDPASFFFYQFEALCRNRLDYDHGLVAISNDPLYDERWSRWILKVRHQIGIVDLTDLVYVYSEFYASRQHAGDPDMVPESILFGEQEGRIALANRQKEPLFFFSALGRQLKYPKVPRPKPRDPADDLLPKLARTVEKLETRIKLLEDEQRGKGIDLSQFFEKPSG